MTQVKICGISTPDAYEAATQADYVGFVFFPPSPRYVTPVRASSLAIGPVAHVGLFVDPTDSQIAEVLGAIDLDVLQLVASPERVTAIRRHFGRPGLASDWGPECHGPSGRHGGAPMPCCSMPEHQPGLLAPGGNAMSFDWTLLAEWDPPGPWLLAGGLTPGNVAAAITATAAPAVDVSSGVERSQGVKDPEMIAAFIDAARMAA